MLANTPTPAMLEELLGPALFPVWQQLCRAIEAVSYTHLDVYKRQAGESKYPLKKMISFALDGITSFSVKPLKLISNLGILISVLSIFGLLYALISYFAGVAVSGWTAIVCSIWLLGGLQMLCLGVVGGYIGKIYSEVKARPRYRVEEYLEQEKQEKGP